MDNNKRFLITTADERSWEFDRPVLFLGEWCRRYNRKSVWSKMDAIVATPYGVTEDERAGNLLFGEKMKAELLLMVTNVLNNYHKTEHPTRYWAILIGHWLYRYVRLIVNRWSTLQQLFENYSISETVVFDLPNYSLATYDSYSFIFATNDDVWNHVLYSKLLKFVKNSSIGRFLNIEDRPFFVVNPITKIKDGNTGGITLGYIIRNFLEKIYRNSDPFIINSHLPNKDVFKLQLALGQLPKRWRRTSCVVSEPNTQLRELLRLNVKGYSGLKKAIYFFVFDILPSCYLEGYSKLVNEAKAVSWPSNPRFIFTSNSFDTDEVFKAWAGEKVEQGVPYFIGQHGNNTGTLKYCQDEIECLEIADKFITWGWSDNNAKCAPAFIFRTRGKKKQQYNKNGELLLIEVHSPHRMESWDTSFTHSIYQKDQFLFVSLLRNDIQSRVTVRLHRSFRQFSWCDDQRWRDQFPAINVDKGDFNIHKLISNSRIVVHSYDSTGILETLALNIPTICFWDHNFNFIRSSAVPYYQKLIDVGILHDSPESAANKVSKMWDCVDEWWFSDKVQKSRETFCGKYAREVKRPIRTIRNLLTNNEDYKN